MKKIVPFVMLGNIYIRDKIASVGALGQQLVFGCWDENLLSLLEVGPLINFHVPLSHQNASV